MFCPHCGYINTDADTVCRSCGRELYSRGPRFSGASKATPVKKPSTKPRPAKGGKAGSPVIKKPEKKEEEIKILKPWAIPGVKKEEEKKEEESSTFQIKTIEVKKEKELKTRFVQGTLFKLIIIGVALAAVVGIFNFFIGKTGGKKTPEEKIFERMIKTGKDSLSPRLHLRRARYYLDRKKYDKAIYDIERAIRLDNKYHEAFFERGKFFLDIKDDPGTAIESFNRAIEIEPKNVEYILNRARAYEVTKEDDLAIADYTRYIKERSDKTAGYLYRGRLYLKKKDIKKALDDLEKASKLDLQSQTVKNALSSAYYEYGLQLKKKGKKKESIEYFEKAVTANPDNIKAQNEVAHYKYQQAKGLAKKKNISGAIEILTEAVNIKPDFTKGFIMRAELYDITGERDNAIKDYQKAFDLNNKNSEVKSKLLKLLTHRAKDREKKGETDLAFSDYSRIIAIDNKNAQAFLQRGLINYSKENYQGAVEDLTAVRKLNPEISDKKILKPLVKSHYEFGKIFESEKNYKEAASQYHKALKLNRNYKPAIEALKAIKDKIKLYPLPFLPLKIMLKL